MIDFALWKIHPAIVFAYIKEGPDAAEKQIKGSYAKGTVDALIFRNSFTEAEASRLLEKELKKLWDPELNRYVTAIITDNTEIVSSFISDENVSKDQVLLSASAYNSSDIAALMLANETDVNCKDTEGWRPLLCACTYNNYEMAMMLVNKGADVDIQSKEGTTPLMLAVANQNEELVRFFIDKGANKKARMSDRSTVVDIAESTGNAKILQLVS